MGFDLKGHGWDEVAEPTTDGQNAPAPQHVDIEKFALINKINPWTLDNYGLLENVIKYTNKARKIGPKPTFIKCPFCGAPKMTYYPDGEFVMWRCDCLGNSFKRNEDILAAQWGLDLAKDKAEIYRRVKEKYPTFDEDSELSAAHVDNNIGIFANETVNEPAENPSPVDKIVQQIIDDLELSKGGFAKLSATDKRGLKNETAERLHFGADENWVHPKMPDSTATPRIIARLGDDIDPPAYNAILTNTGRKKFKWAMDKKIKWADKCLTANKKLVFNPSALDEYIAFLSEGEIDAASICQASDWKILACALGGTTGGRDDLIQRLAKKAVKPKLIVLFDEDARHPPEDFPDQETRVETILKMLTQIRVPAVAKFFDDFITDDEKKAFVKVDADGKRKCKIDANEILIVKGEKFLNSLLNKIIVDASDELDRLTEEYVAAANNDNVDLPNRVVEKTNHDSRRNSQRKDLPKEIQDVLDRVNDSLTPQNVGDFLDRAKKRGHICPRCGNGSGSHGTGVDFKSLPTPRVVCHCGWSENALGLFATKNNLNLNGKDFFTTLRKAADYFHVKYDPKIFDFTPSHKNIFTDEPPADKNVDPKIAEWEAVNGKIDPQLLPEIIDAAKYLQTFTINNFTPENAQSSKTKRALALCKFYDFNIAVFENFFELLTNVKDSAKTQLKLEKENAEFVAAPSPDIKILARLSLTEIRSEIKPLVKDLRKAHKNFQRHAQFEAAKEKDAQNVANRDIPDGWKLTPKQIEKLFGPDNTDKSNAERLKFVHGDEIRFLAEDDTWFAYDKKSGLWRRGTKRSVNGVMRFAAKMATLLELNLPSKYQYPDAEEVVKGWKSAKKAALAFTYLKGDDSIVIKNSDLDRHKNLLNCKNGVVDLQTGRFYPTVELNPSWLITKQCNAFWHNGHFRSNRVDKYFETLIPDYNTRCALISWLGYSLTGEVDQQIVHFWKGSGANGKSTLINFILELFGTYGVKMMTAAILQQRTPSDANAATAALNPIEGARIAIFNELKPNDHLNGPLVKDLSGGDKLTLRPMYLEARQIYPTAKLTINGNFFPKPDNINDDGLLRRIRTIEFTQVFKDNDDFRSNDQLSKPDVKLLDKLIQPDELSAFLTMLVIAAQNYYAEGKIFVSDAMTRTRAEYIAENDFMQEFVDEYCVTNDGKPKDGAFITGKDFVEALRDNFRRECAQFNDKQLRDLFHERFPDFQYKKYGKAGVKSFVGIGLIDAKANIAEAERNGQKNNDDDLVIPPEFK